MVADVAASRTSRCDPDRAGTAQIQVIKAEGELTSLGSRRPRTSSTAPGTILEKADKAAAEAAKAKLEEAGASVELE